MAAGNEEEPLKALVFADACADVNSQSSAAKGISGAASLPLHESSLLHWQLYALARSGVDEAIVLSSRPRDDLPTSPVMGCLKVTALTNATWCSPGDALREVESRVALRPRHDFVIVHHGTLFNMDVAAMVRSHKQRCKADRNWLVTLTLRNGVAYTPLITAMQTETGALCFYSDAASLDEVSLDAKGDNAGLRFGGTVQISADVVDVGLDICSPDFLIEFRENFDFDNVRDYVRAKLDGGEAELLGNRIYAHFVDSHASEYATRIDSFGAYMTASRDVFDGWMHPIRPARVLRMIWGQHTAVGDCNVICRGDGPQPSGELCSAADVVLGENVTVGKNVVLRRAVIGGGVRIGNEVTVEDSVILGGATVADNTRLVGKLIDGQNVSVSVDTARWPDFMNDAASDIDDELEGIPASEMDEEDAGDSVDGMNPVNDEHNGTKSVGQEIRETVERGVQMNAEVEAITLEVRHLTREYELNYGRSYSNPLLNVICGVIDVLLAELSSIGARGAPKHVKMNLTKWSALIKKFSLRFGAGLQRELLDGSAAAFRSNGRLLMYVWKELYDMDVLEEEAILHWAASMRSDLADGKDDGILWEGVREFVEWLEQAEEEDDEGSEEE
jgi:NDP-sugar pyrophosphorylase family protein